MPHALRLVAFLSALLLVAGCAADQTISPQPRELSAGSSAARSARHASATSSVLSGTLLDYDTHAPVVGARVALGAAPPRRCFAWLGCGHPYAPQHLTKTSAQGTFTFAHLPSGVYFLRISYPGYAELHERLVYNGTLALTLALSQLTPDELAWLEQVEIYRSTLSVPPSRGEIVFDESLEEAARTWAADVADGTIPYGDPTYSYPKNYPAFFDYTGAIGDLNTSWQGADTQWFAERENCPHENWLTCPWADNTGHYIILSDDADTWVGLGESLQPLKSGLPWAGYYAYGGLFFISDGGYNFNNALADHGGASVARWLPARVERNNPNSNVAAADRHGSR